VDTKSTADDFEQEIRDVQAALERAALRARRIAAQTGTDLIIVKDGMLVREKIDWDFEKQVER
jgi:hypothetical protein